MLRNLKNYNWWLKYKLVLVLGLILLISSTISVSASIEEAKINITGGTSEDLISSLEKGFKQGEIKEGWNLLRGFNYPDGITSSSEIVPSNIKAVYILKQPSQEYIRLYPDAELDKLVDIDDSYYEKTAQWVFSDKSGKINYLGEEPLPLEEHKLYAGWNLLGITHQMYDKYPGGVFKFNSIKGTCDYESVYLYSTLEEEWGTNLIAELDKAFNENYLMNGFAVKVKSDCFLKRI
jgi:hypothetical protein